MIKYNTPFVIFNRWNNNGTKKIFRVSHLLCRIVGVLMIIMSWHELIKIGHFWWMLCPYNLKINDYVETQLIMDCYYIFRLVRNTITLYVYVMMKNVLFCLVMWLLFSPLKNYDHFVGTVIHMHDSMFMIILFSSN